MTRQHLDATIESTEYGARLVVTGYRRHGDALRGFAALQGEGSWSSVQVAAALVSFAVGIAGGGIATLLVVCPV